MKEIERKFRVINSNYKKLAVSELKISQWYINRDKLRVVRVRICGDKAMLTVKGKTEGISRNEFEYEIPISDAIEMKSLADGKVIEKTRFIVPFDGKLWEVDEFHGSHEGLVIAEIELNSPDEEIKLPDFIGEEVSNNPRYFNSSLAE